eukprot:3460464-Prorocentrum_lima.AAC.1
MQEGGAWRRGGWLELWSCISWLEAPSDWISLRSPFVLFALMVAPLDRAEPWPDPPARGAWTAEPFQ